MVRQANPKGAGRTYVAKYIVDELALLKGAYTPDFKMFTRDGKPVPAEELKTERGKKRILPNCSFLGLQNLPRLRRKESLLKSSKPN